MADSPDTMRIFDNRLASFGRADHPSKKHQSSHGKGVPKQWPHETPTPAELAAAGFYYEPISRSTDNAKCFQCKVNLGGWEIDDEPLKEHLAHSSSCAWAIARSVTLGDEDRDPMSEKLLEARLKTFEHWPHESKRGWKPKAKKMAESGWCMDTGPDADDGATCFYCDLALDGWEQKDDPMKEHKKRQPECRFFQLVDRHAASRPKKARGRASNASKASRLSTQSIQSTFSEAPSLMSLGDATPLAELDTSIGTITSTTSTTKGRKKAGAAKGKGKKKVAREPSQDATELATALTHLEESMAPSQSLLQGTQEDTDIAMEDSVAMSGTAGPTKKTTRAKAKGKKVAVKVSQDEDDDQSQLQTELAASVLESQETKPNAKPKRGKKRTSDGEEKVDEPSVQIIDETTAHKPKKGRSTRAKKAKAMIEDTVVQEESSTALAADPYQLEASPVVEAPKTKKGRKPKATKKAKSPSPEPEPEKEEMGEEDGVSQEEDAATENYIVHAAEEESEANYEVHDESSANFIVHDHTATIDEELEPSPTPHKVPPPPPPKDTPPKNDPTTASSTPRSAHSHQSSDAENHPPSSKTKQQKNDESPIAALNSQPTATAAAPILLSPSKTTRVPLSAETPNRSPRRASPTKLGMLKTSQPWSAVDIETIFASTADLAIAGQENAGMHSGDGPVKRAAQVSGDLKSPEKRMTVEQWVRFQAQVGESRLKEECERVVWLFEREGRRAMGVLQGVQVNE